MGNQKLKTQVVKKNINPEWNEDLALSISDPHHPVQLFVYDKDKFFYDKVGEPEFDVNPLVEALMGKRSRELPHGGAIFKRIKPNQQNCLAEESQIVLKDDKIIQNTFLRLNNVERGDVELQLHWIHITHSDMHYAAS